MDSQGGSRLEATSVGEPAIPPTVNERSLSPRRVRGRSLAASLFAEAQQSFALRDDSCSDEKIAQHLGVTDTTVLRWGRPQSGLPLQFGDVLALPRALAREVLVRALGAMEEGTGPGPRDTLDRITIELGQAVADLQRDLVDGRMDDPARHSAHLCRIGSLALRGYLALGKGATP